MKKREMENKVLEVLKGAGVVAENSVVLHASIELNIDALPRVTVTQDLVDD